MNFADVGYEEAMRRARECVPVLRERAQKCEDARVLLPENEKLLHETGLFRFHQPKRFDGMELPFIAVVDIVAELARGCPSTAWNVGNLGCHHWILAYYEPETQHEIWDANPDVLIASSIALAAGRGRGAEERLPDHRYLVCDGHGRHGQQGHRGRGGVRARAPRARPRPLPRRPGASGRCAEQRLERVKESFTTRVGTYTGAKVGDFQAVQIKLAEARCLIDSARYLMRESAMIFQETLPDLETKLRLRAQNAFAVAQCRKAVEVLWSCYGANAIYTRDPLQRYMRDLQAINQHFSFNFDIAGAAYGLLSLGGKYANPTM